MQIALWVLRISISWGMNCKDLAFCRPCIAKPPIPRSKHDAYEADEPNEDHNDLEEDHEGDLVVPEEGEIEVGMVGVLEEELGENDLEGLVPVEDGTVVHEGLI